MFRRTERRLELSYNSNRTSRPLFDAEALRRVNSVTTALTPDGIEMLCYMQVGIDPVGDAV
jgi:hypothetical protein